MRHKKCGGPVFVDRLYPQDKRLELYCMMCGNRWFLPRDKGNKFTTWLARLETFVRAGSVSSI